MSIMIYYDTNTKYHPLSLSFDKDHNYPVSREGNSALCQEHRDFLPLFKKLKNLSPLEYRFKYMNK